jgi:hypothetical protein
MSPQLDTAFHWLPAMFGGRQSARSIHFILTILFVGFTFGHVFMVLATGVINNMRSMVSGWYKEKVPAKQKPAGLENFTEEIIQKPVNVTVPHQLPSPEVDEVSPAQETLSAPAEPEQQDNGMSKPSIDDEHPGPENSPQTARTQAHEIKKDIEE